VIYWHIKGVCFFLSNFTLNETKRKKKKYTY